MSTMYGADVAQLRTLAGQFDRMATKLDSDRMSVGNAIQISAWVGPVAVRFRHTWDSDYSRRLHSAAERLRAAARSLRSNADDQERTSAASPGLGAGGSFPNRVHTLPATLAPNPIQGFVGAVAAAPRNVVSWMSNVNSTVDGLGTLSDVYKLNIKTPGMTGPLGVMFDTADSVDAFSNGDYVGGALSGISGIFGMVAKPNNPIGLGISVGKTSSIGPCRIHSSRKTRPTQWVCGTSTDHRLIRTISRPSRPRL